MNLFFVERVVGVCARYAGYILLGVLVLGVAAGYYTVTHFKMNTDTESLISSDTAWRKREIAHNKAFPQQTNLIAIVVDGVTPERAEEAASSLTAALATNPKLFPLSGARMRDRSSRITGFCFCRRTRSKRRHVR
jgi:predicted RND superfamily exporter protein